ncbi:MAG: hypothetical protein PVI39_12480, partial [Desulfobacteraceae bacterium]
SKVDFAESRQETDLSLTAGENQGGGFGAMFEVARSNGRKTDLSDGVAPSQGLTSAILAKGWGRLPDKGLGFRPIDCAVAMRPEAPTVRVIRSQVSGSSASKPQAADQHSSISRSFSR